MRLKKMLFFSLLFFIFSCARPVDDEPEPEPRTPPDIFNITSTGYFTCAQADQKIKCWGENGGRLGAGTTDDQGDTQAIIDSIPYVNLGDNFKTIDIKSGFDHICALSASGDVKCWGNTDNEGFLGKEEVKVIGHNSNDMGNNLLKIELGNDFDSSVTKLFNGGNCVQIQSGDVKCWGRNEVGQLGLGDNGNRGFATNTMGTNLPKISLGQTFDIKKITITPNNGCALNQSGDMKCWGNVDYGIVEEKPNGTIYVNNIGDEDGEMGDDLKIIDLGNEFTVSDFDLGFTHACAISTAGKLKCWGSNRFGELGQDHKKTALGINADDLGDNLPEITLGFTVKQVSAGGAHTCALSTEGRIKCWGDNDYGQLGYGDKKTRGQGVSNYTMDDLDYVNLGDDFEVINIEIGHLHSCAVSSNYEVKCWGEIYNKQVLRGAAGGYAGDQANEMGNNLKPVVLFKD